MIKPQGLRYLNLVDYNGEYLKVASIYPTQVVLFRNVKPLETPICTLPILLTKIKSIPLTEELLLKAGFNKDAMYFTLHGLTIVRFTDDLFHLLIRGYDVIIKSFHHLQNLVFDLTGQELTLNL